MKGFRGVLILFRLSLLFLILNFGAGCGSATIVSSSVATSTFKIGGTLTGLSGTVVLQNNGVDDLTLTKDSEFAFATGIEDGRDYAVTVLTQPAGLTCSVSNGTGVVSGAAVTDVSVVCSAVAYTVGGTINGLSGTVVLHNNGGNALTSTADGAFTFTTAVADGAGYEVTVKTQPGTQTCSVSGGKGTISGANATDVSVVCSTTTYTVGGTISGLSGTVVLHNNGGNALTSTADGTFTFTTAVADGAGYAVTVKTQPGAQTCSVASGTGTMSGAHMSDVTVTCAANTYTVGGTISGLSGTVVLQNNGGNALTSTANSAFTFTTAVADGAGYEVTVKTQPGTQTCSVASGSGTMSGANVTNVTVVCSTNTYTVGGTISGLSGTVVLQNNGGNALTSTANSAFTFTTAVADGAAYEMTVKTQPSGASCSVASGTGTISGANVTNVTVTCEDDTFTVGGTISGLSGTVVLQNNGGNNLSKTTNGSFTFSTALADGAAFSVTVLTNPARQQCAVSNTSGSIGSANVSNVSVACVDVRKIFVTATSYNGNLKGSEANGIAGADAKCAADTNKPAGGSTYKALIVDYPTDSDGNRYVCTNLGDCRAFDACDAATSKDWVLQKSMRYIRTDGTVIGTTNSKCVFGVFDGSALTNSIGSSGTYWIGIYDKWVTPQATTCSKWTSSSNTDDLSDSGRIGSLTATDSTAFYVTSSLPFCNNSQSLVCVEQ